MPLCWDEYLPHNNSSNDTVMENSDEPIVRAADLIGSMAKNMDAQQAARAIDAPNCSSQAPSLGKNADRDNAMPYLELSLKRSRSTADGADAAIQEEQRNVVRRSDLSAFTRYNTCAVSNQGGAGFVGSCSPNGNSSEAAKTDAAPMKQGSNGSSNNNDMGSTTKSVVTKPGGNNKVSPFNGNTHTSAFHRVQPWTPAIAAGKDKADEVSKKNAAAAAKDNGTGFLCLWPWIIQRRSSSRLISWKKKNNKLLLLLPALATYHRTCRRRRTTVEYIVEVRSRSDRLPSAK